MIISKTPLRMSFAGGGSDLKSYYNRKPGAVLSTSIDKFVYVMVNRKFDNYIRVGYSQTEYVNSVDEIGHNLVRESLRKVGVFSTGIDIVYMADVLPRKWGTGLGFSSSLTVGLLNALYALKGEKVSSNRLAEEACEIEINILGAPIGKQDQYAAAFGGLNYIKFNPDDSVDLDPVKITNKDLKFINGNLLLFYTGLSSISENVLREQKINTESKSQTRNDIDAMVEIAASLKKDFELGNSKLLGKKLHENWILKTGLSSKITNNQIDIFYQKAREAGAEGGKILGSGGGGFLLIYAEKEHHEKIRLALREINELEFNITNNGSSIVEL